MPELTGTKDLRSYLRVLWRWKWLFLFFLIAAPAVAYLVERGKPNVYKSSALVGVNSTTVNTSLLNAPGSFSTTNVTAIAQLVTTTPVADLAAALLTPPGSPGQIASEVSASGDTTTNFLTISAQDRSPIRAAAIANAFARAISRNLRQSAIAQINQTIRGLRAQLDQIKPTAANAPNIQQLQQEITQLAASRSTQVGEAAILQAATPSGTPVGGGLRRTVELGLLIGLLLGFGAVVLAESSDRRLRTPEDLEGVTELPLLAAIEPSAFSGDLSTRPEDDEAFQMLRTALMYFNVDRRVDSILITSAGEKDGKTTVATRLALATAVAGLNVILVDADLRRAQVTARLGMETDGGLGAVIAGSQTLHDVLADYSLDGPGVGRLRVLPAGRPPPNPSALMSSQALHGILRELGSQSDLVIIDTPAALAVSDPLPLMRIVSGVVLVARMNRSSRQTVRRLQRIVGSAHGNLLGVVATGVATGYEGYYQAYYAHNGNNGGRGLARLRRHHRDEKSLDTVPDE